MAEKNTTSNAELDGLLAAAASLATTPSSELMQRIIADADAVAEAKEVKPKPAPQPRRRGILGGLLAAIGGWPAMAGLATATVAGVWIGYASPDTLDGIANGLLTSRTAYEVGDFMPTLDDLFYEG
ncbi:MAG: hypothetical protein ACU0DI_03715 [Paracoccaceae bacterium]